MRCDGCEHWSRGNAYGDRKRANGLVVRQCKRAHEWWEATEWHEDCEEDADTFETIRRVKPERAGDKMFVQDGSDYKAYLYTVADFFCAHFQKQG